MSWTHLLDTQPKARKRYQCYLCGRFVEIGQAHVKRTGISEGEFTETRMHSDCELKTKKWTEDEWECHNTSDFREYELEETPEHSN